MAEEIEGCDGDESAEEIGVDGRGLHAPRVEVKCEEADRDVQSFARDLVPVDKGAPVSVNGNEA